MEDNYSSKRKEISVLLQSLDCKLNFICDVWQSPNNDYILGIIVSFISKRTLQNVSLLIDLINIKDDKGETLFRNFIDCLVEYKIERKLMSVVTDNGNCIF